MSKKNKERKGRKGKKRKERKGKKGKKRKGRKGKEKDKSSVETNGTAQLMFTALEFFMVSVSDFGVNVQGRFTTGRVLVRPTHHWDLQPTDNACLC